MKPDLDYTKRLLDAIEAMPGPTRDTEESRAAGFSVDKTEFIFHLRLLEDQHLVEGAARAHVYVFTNLGRTVAWTRVPLRMTTHGHDLAANLRAPKVMEPIKTKYGEAAFNVWVHAAATLAGAYVSN